MAPRREPTNKEIMEKLIALEEKIDAYINPVKSYNRDKKIQIISEAIASGDRARIKAVQRQFNGK